MAHFYWPEHGLGPVYVPSPTIQEVITRLAPPSVRQASKDFVRSTLDKFEISQRLSITLREFMRNIVIEPARSACRDDPQFENLLTDALELGLPLVMVPEGDLLRRVISADTYDESSAQLLASKDMILERCRIMLGGRLPGDFQPASSEALREVRPVAIEALEMLLSDQWAGAQATATTVLDTLLSLVLGSHMTESGREDHLRGRFQLVNVREVIKIIRDANHSDSDNAFAINLILPPLLHVFEFSGHDMKEYNRHASVHRASKTQYTPANALIAVMHMCAVFVLMSCVGPDAVPPPDN